MNGYNGYTNYATWNLDLWVANEKPLYDLWVEKSVKLKGIWTELEARAFSAKLFGSQTRDGAKLDDVNWREIAEHWTEWASEHDLEMAS